MNKKITTRTKILIVLFILGLHLSAYHLMNSTSFEEPVSAAVETSDFSSTSQEGAYKLVAGTDGCPPRIEWLSSHAEQCRGFSLNVTELNAGFRIEKFCNLNGGAKISQRTIQVGSERTRMAVTSSENIIQKKTSVTTITASGTRRSPQEDTLIFDEPGKFLWEHSRDRRGYSCLYSREAS